MPDDPTDSLLDFHTVGLTIRLPRWLRRATQAQADREGNYPSAIIRRALTTELERLNRARRRGARRVARRLRRPGPVAT